jgi:hypothetical protein
MLQSIPLYPREFPLENGNRWLSSKCRSGLKVGSNVNCDATMQIAISGIGNSEVGMKSIDAGNARFSELYEKEALSSAKPGTIPKFISLQMDR